MLSYCLKCKNNTENINLKVLKLRLKSVEQCYHKKNQDL